MSLTEVEVFAFSSGAAPPSKVVVLDLASELEEDADAAAHAEADADPEADDEAESVALDVSAVLPRC